MKFPRILTHLIEISCPIFPEIWKSSLSSTASSISPGMEMKENVFRFYLFFVALRVFFFLGTQEQLFNKSAFFLFGRQSNCSWFGLREKVLRRWIPINFLVFSSEEFILTACMEFFRLLQRKTKTVENALGSHSRSLIITGQQSCCQSKGYQSSDQSFSIFFNFLWVFLNHIFYFLFAIITEINTTLRNLLFATWNMFSAYCWIIFVPQSEAIFKMSLLKWHWYDI